MNRRDDLIEDDVVYIASIYSEVISALESAAKVVGSSKDFADNAIAIERGLDDIFANRLSSLRHEIASHADCEIDTEMPRSKWRAEWERNEMENAKAARQVHSAGYGAMLGDALEALNHSAAIQLGVK